MGSQCGCLYPTVIPIDPEVYNMASAPKWPKRTQKHQVIQPLSVLELDQSQMQLNLIAENIDHVIFQYEFKNGVLSKRFTERQGQKKQQEVPLKSWEHLIHSRQILQEKQSEVKQQQKCDKQQTVSFKQMTNREIQRNKQSKKSVADIKQPVKNEKQKVNESKEKENAQPVDMIELNSDSEETGQENKRDKSGVISQTSCVLQQSIFTERIQAKKHFYAQKNRIGSVTLLQQQESDKVAYQIGQHDLDQLRSKAQYSSFVLSIEALRHYWRQHFIQLIGINPKGLKIHVNGIKRIYPLTFQGKQPSVAELGDKLYNHFGRHNCSEWLYLLAGWVSEQLNIEEIINIKGIFQRLFPNIAEGNAIISFSKRYLNTRQEALLLGINLQKQTVTISSFGTASSIPKVLQISSNLQGQVQISMECLMQVFDHIHINWNPYIYEVRISRQAVIDSRTAPVNPNQTATDTRQSLASQNQVEQITKSNRYSLMVPPSSQDIEIRLLMEEHHEFIDPNYDHYFQIQLYEAQSFSEVGSNEAIRTIITKSRVFSDVFIFESCQEKTQYFIVVTLFSPFPVKNMYYTFSMLSFTQIKFNHTQIIPVAQSLSLKAHINIDKVGFGINSPYFHNNLQLALQVSPQHQLQVRVDAYHDLTYELCLIPDIEATQNLTQLKLQSIINSSTISPERNGPSSFKFKTHFSHYIVMLNAFTSSAQATSLTFNLYQKKRQSNSILKVFSVKNHLPAFKLCDFKWLPSHTGPRKRLKTNSNNKYQDMSVFIDFFKNPFVEERLPKGKYQFFVKSETFKQLFDSLDSYEDKNVCDPPALSMCILQRNGQEYRIVQDDAYYVPFGMGFWTKIVELEEGQYRFVCPKMEKGFSKGTFGIIQH